MKKHLILIVLSLLCAIDASAVLKESNLDQSLAVLKHELITYHREQSDIMLNSKLIGDKARSEIMDIMERSSQNSLMLYSQKTDYVFDLTYACNEATRQYQEFKTKMGPFVDLVNRSNSDIQRYDSLIDVLSTMPVMMLSERAKIDRNVCLTLAVNIRRMLTDNNASLQEYIQFYHFAEQRLKGMNDYAQKRYRDIQTNIFLNGGSNYFDELSQVKWKLLNTRMALVEKYTPDMMVKSQWDVRWIIFLFSALALYSLLALLINLVSIRVVLTRLMRRGMFKNQQEGFMAKRTCIILAASVVTLGIILCIVRVAIPSNFIQMASKLLIEFSWLLAVIFISLLLRVSGSQISSAFRIYAPIIVVGFVVISFRIVFIPSDFVNLFFPPILLACAVWQWSVVSRHRRNVPKYDVYLTYASQTVFVVSLVAALLGYTLLSVQILIWWIMQMTCLLTIACLHDWVMHYYEKWHIADSTMTRQWAFKFVYKVILPSLIVCSFMLSIYWAADVFNLSEMTWQIFMTDFVDNDYIKLSVFNIAQAIIGWFVCKYISQLAQMLIRNWTNRVDATTAATRSVMFINLTKVLIWGVWLLLVLWSFHVNNTWFVVVSGGLSTGVGFAMKDIIENVYYGISLMAGRVKIGDYIVCDGIRGRVSHISYSSTMVEAIDGSVIAFTNSQLFAKNYKNMTRNHGKELDILEVGVAYGTNIERCRKLLVDAISQLKCVDKKRGVKVVLKSFDDSCITLKVLIWVNVLSQYGDDGTVMECIYDTLNKNNIEIPFPQRVVTIQHGGEQLPDKEQKA